MLGLRSTTVAFGGVTRDLLFLRCFFLVLRHTPGTPGTGFTSLLLTGGGCRMGLGARVRHTGSPAAHSKIPVIPGGWGNVCSDEGWGHEKPHPPPSLGGCQGRVFPQPLTLPTQENHFRPKSSKPKGKGPPNSSSKGRSSEDWWAGPHGWGLTSQGWVDRASAVQILHGERRNPVGIRRGSRWTDWSQHSPGLLLPQGSS